MRRSQEKSEIRIPEIRKKSENQNPNEEMSDIHSSSFVFWSLGFYSDFGYSDFGLPSLPFFGNLRSRAFDDREQLLLFLVRNLEFVEGRLQVAHGGVELRVGNVHPGMRGLHFLAVIDRRPARRQRDKLDHVFFQLLDIL